MMTLPDQVSTIGALLLVIQDSYETVGSYFDFFAATIAGRATSHSVPLF
jgi:hypothetical protein